MNAPKTTRGVQESDVWAAADALLAQGLRPTIERVRLHIGRGSPNTVSPMLESWFGTLGERLGIAEQKRSICEQIPAPVLELSTKIWQQSIKEASQLLEAQLQARADAITQAQSELDAAMVQFEQRAQAFEQQKKTLDEALQLARKQNDEQSKRLDEAHQLLRERDAMLDALRQEMTAKHQQQEEMQKQHAVALQGAAEERQRLAEQFAGNERRMLGELDRARQEQAQMKKQMLETERRQESRYEELHARYVESEEALVAARSELLTSKNHMEIANERIEYLKTLLQTRSNSGSGDNNVPEAKSARTRPLRSVARTVSGARIVRKLK